MTAGGRPIPWHHSTDDSDGDVPSGGLRMSTPQGEAHSEAPAASLLCWALLHPHIPYPASDSPGLTRRVSQACKL